MSRVRGFAEWRPQAKTLALLAQVDLVLEEYRQHLPLTLRQVFYRLVGAYGYAKTEDSYARLCENLNRARRAGRVPFEAIRDDGLTVLEPGGFSGTPDFWRAVERTASNYRRDRLDGQALAIEVWVEAAGMAPQLYAAIKEYGVPVFSSGGFDSLTGKHAAACRISGEARPTAVLHVGDLDPSGLALFASAAEDVSALVAGLDGTAPRFERIAVTREQVERFGLPTSPPKRTDRRGVWRDGDQTVQAEALPPDVLAAELRREVARLLDHERWAAVVEAERSERAELVVTVAGIGGE